MQPWNTVYLMAGDVTRNPQPATSHTVGFEPTTQPHTLWDSNPRLNLTHCGIRTHDLTDRNVKVTEAHHSGETALQPWNTGYLMAGDVTRKLDPYFPFEKAVEMWGRSFKSLGIAYKVIHKVYEP